MVKINKFYLKSQFYTLKNLFKKNYNDSDRSSNVLSREIIKFGKYLVVLELYARMFVKMAQICFRKKTYDFGTNEGIYLKI